MKDRFLNLYDKRKKHLQSGTCVIWFCGTVAFEGQTAMKALVPLVKIPYSETKRESSYIAPSVICYKHTAY